MAAILMVDDILKDSDEKQFYAGLMAEHNHTPSFAENGTIGLRMLTERKPDYIILDMDMPETDGLQFLRALKRMGMDIEVVVNSSFRPDYVREKVGLTGYEHVIGYYDDNMSISDLLESLK